MAYASRSGHARTNARAPSAFGRCDRCSFWYQRSALQNQAAWRGTSLQPLYIFVCSKCLDIPTEQIRAITLPADPIPIWQPRVEDFVSAETDYRSLAGSTTDPNTGIPIPNPVLRVTEDCENRITIPLGCPEGLTQPAVMPYNSGIQKAFGTKLSVVSMIANGTATVSVTCSAPHGLVTDSQVSVAGTQQKCADGFFSVCVRSAMAFTYAAYANIPSGPLLTGTTRVVTALVGLPYGSKQIPQVCDCGPSTASKSQPLTTDSGIQITTDSGEPIYTSPGV